MALQRFFNTGVDFKMKKEIFRRPFARSSTLKDMSGKSYRVCFLKQRE